MSWFTTSNRLWDREGSVAYDNYGVAIAKSLTYRHLPYVVTGDSIHERSIEFNFHFIKNLRRVLSGVTGDTRFSPSELGVYLRYIAWVNDESVVIDPLEVYILGELDNWLMDDLQQKVHLKMLRNYTRENRWR